jgi:hypothetical protein
MSEAAKRPLIMERLYRSPASRCSARTKHIVLQVAGIIGLMPEAMLDDLVMHWYDYWRRYSGTRAERKALAAGDPSDVIAAHDWVADRIEAGGLAAAEVLATWRRLRTTMV